MASRKLTVEIIGDSKSLERSFDRSTRASKEFDRNMSHTFRGVVAGSGAFSSLGRSVAFASGAFLGGAGLTAVLKSSVGAASNLAEQQNKVDVVFGASGRTITQWGKTTATSIGIANDQALEAAGTFGNLFHTVNLAPAASAKLSRSLVQLAADLASFNNADPSEVLNALQSGLIGEAEPLRRFGVLLSETRVQQEAMRETGVKSAKNLTDQQKVIARYNLILRDTKQAQGDFARTQDGLANASRQLQAEIRDTEAAVGKALLPTVKEITKRLRDWLGDTNNQQKIQRTLNATLVTTGEVMTDLKPVAQALGDTIVGIAKAVDKLNSAFDKIPGHSASLTDLFNKIPGHGASGVDLFKDLFGSGGEHLPKPLRQGQSPIGENALGNRDPVASAKESSDAIRRRLGLIARFKKADLALAKAERTKITSDDRAVLLVEAAIVKEQIASRKKVFKDKVALERQLGGIEQQIDAIDKSTADARAAATDARKQRAQDRLSNLLQGLELGIAKAGLTKGLGDDIKAAQAQVAALKQQVALHKTSIDLQQQLVSAELQLASLRDQQLANQQAARQKQLDAAKKARDRFVRQANELKDVIQTERDRIGQLFSGPVFNPSDAQRKTALGAPTPGANAKLLIADLKGQIQQFRSFERDIRTLQKRGAPPQLLAELRQQGLGVAPQVHALATAGAGTLAQFKKLFIQREGLAASTAAVEKPINIHLTVNVNKDTGAVKVVRTTPHGQKRGNNPGVTVNPVNPGRP